MLLSIEFTTAVGALQLLEIVQSFLSLVNIIMYSTPDMQFVVNDMRLANKTVNIELSHDVSESASIFNYCLNIAQSISKAINARASSDYNNIELDQRLSLFFSRLESAKIKKIAIDDVVIDNFLELSKPRYTLSDIKVQRETVINSVDNLYLTLKKADFITDSLWQFVYNKVIYARIEDELFLRKIRSGELRLCAGMKLFCKTRVTAIYDKLNMRHPKHISYTVLNVKNISELTNSQLNLSLEAFV